MARQRYIVPEAPSPIVRDFKTRLEEEIDTYSNKELCGLQVSPCDWWREKKETPYVGAILQCKFQLPSHKHTF